MYVTQTSEDHVLITYYVCILINDCIIYRIIFMLGMYEFEHSCFKRFYQSTLCKMYYILVIEIMSKIILCKSGKIRITCWKEKHCNTPNKEKCIQLVKTPFAMCPKVEFTNSGHLQIMLFALSAFSRRF